MPAAPVPAPQPDYPVSLAARAFASIKRILRSLSRREQVGVAVGAAVLLAMGLYLALSGSSATLKLVGRHGFRSAEVTVWADGTLAYHDQLSGGAKKRLGLFPKTAGAFSKTLSLTSGQHVIQVRFTSMTDRYDQNKRCTVNLTAGKELTLLITAERGGMSLVTAGALPAPVQPAPGDYALMLRSVLVTVGGSITSAVIGFLVQDFLRTRKARVAALSETSKISS